MRVVSSFQVTNGLVGSLFLYLLQCERTVKYLEVMSSKQGNKKRTQKIHDCKSLHYRTVPTPDTFVAYLLEILVSEMGKWTSYKKMGKRRNGSIIPSVLPSLSPSLLYQSTRIWIELQYKTSRTVLRDELGIFSPRAERREDTATRQSSGLSCAWFYIHASSDYFINGTMRICSLSLMLTSCPTFDLLVNLKKKKKKNGIP